MLERLKSQNLAIQCDEGSVTQSEHSAKLILFDVSHRESLKTYLPSTEQSEREREVLEDEQQAEGERRDTSDRETKLIKLLRQTFEPDFKVALGFSRTIPLSDEELDSETTNDEPEYEADFNSSRSIALTDEVLDPEKTKVLVLAAPNELLSPDEVEAIINFVHEGGSLLIAHNYYSLFEQERQLYEQEQNLRQEDVGVSINELMKAFGLSFKRLLNIPPDDISTLNPHYISSDINKIFLRDPVYLEVLEKPSKTWLNSPHVIARLPETNEVFLTAVAAKWGRVVAIGDYALFEDDYIDYGNHQPLILNVFRWLTEQERLDCFDASIETEVRQGHTATFSIVLINPKPERLEHIHCLLESDAGIEIVGAEKRVRSLAPYAQTQLQWTVEAKQLGQHTLRLIIELPQEESTLFFDAAAQFECLPDGEIDLVIVDRSDQMRGVVETGQPFEVMAVLRKTIDIKESALQFQLDSPSSNLKIEAIEQAGASRWRLHALEPGELPVTLMLGKTGKQLPTYLFHARPSVRDQIATIEREKLQPLAAQAHYHVSQIRREFDRKEIRQIPCHIYTPEEQVRLLNPPRAAEQMLEALRVARLEDKTNLPLVKYLLTNIAPSFSPVHGCCIPYDPKLATHLSRQHPLYQDNLAQNFLILEGQESRLEQNLAALVLHEKYGHGFFFTQTTLGRQLAILYRHGMTNNADLKQLKSPYPRSLYEKYRWVIQTLWDSSLIANEGFAAWVEQAVLPRFGGAIAESAYRRKDFLFHRDNGLSLLSNSSDYFKNFPPFYDSRYREGCERLQEIQNYFGEDCGSKCAVQVIIKAADVDAGITESGGKVQFALDTSTLRSSLLDVSSPDARSDVRLRLIHSALKDSVHEIQAEQKRLNCHLECLHSECPVNRVIQEKQGW